MGKTKKTHRQKSLNRTKRLQEQKRSFEKQQAQLIDTIKKEIEAGKFKPNEDVLDKKESSI